MQARVIMWNGERGVVAASGQRHEFDINQWVGDFSPKADMDVVLAFDEGNLKSITPLEVANPIEQNAGANAIIETAKNIVMSAGKDVSIAYGVFFVFAFFVGMVKVSTMMVPISLPLITILNGITALSSGQGGFGTVLGLLAVGTIAVPYFWKHKLAPIALCAPLLLTLYAYLQIYLAYASTKEQLANVQTQMANNPYAGMMAGAMEQAYSAFKFQIAFGAYVTTAIAAFIAYRGVMRYLESGK